MTTRRSYRLRIRTRADDADYLVLTSVRGGENPYLAGPPEGDGTGLDLLSSEVTTGAYTWPVIDAVASAASTPSAVEDFSDAALYASRWSSPGGTVGSWNLTGTGAGQRLRVDVSSSGAGDAAREWTVTGLPPGAPLTVTVEFSYSALGGAVDGNEINLVVNGLVNEPPPVHPAFIGSGGGTLTTLSAADASGEALIRLGVFGMGAGRVVQVDFDNVRVYEGSILGEGRVVTQHLADDDGKLQLLSLPAYGEWSDDAQGMQDAGTPELATWAPLHNGYVTSDSLETALVYGIQVGDTQRVEQHAELFRVADLDVARPGCVLGGPVPGGFGPVPDFGPVRFEVLDTANTNGRALVTLQFVSGYLPPWFARSFALRVLDDEYAEVNAVAKRFFVERATWAPVGTGTAPLGHYPGLTAVFEPVGGGDPVTFPSSAGLGVVGHPTTYLRAGAGPVVHFGDPGILLHRQSRTVSLLRVDWGPYAAGGYPPDTTQFDVLLYPTAVTPETPAHVAGHPCDLAALARAQIQQTVTPASIAATKAAIDPAGGAHVFEGTYGAPLTVAAFEAALGRVYGFAVVPAPTPGTFEMIPTRAARSVVQTITGADLRGPGTAFEHEESTVVNAIDMTVTRYRRWTRDDPGGQRPLDMVAPSEDRAEGPRGDTAVFSTRTETLELPGSPQVLADGETAPGPLPLLTFLKGVIDPATDLGDGTGAGDVLIDRYARGAVFCELPCLPAVTARVGDWVGVDVAHVPVASAAQTPPAQRMDASGLARTMAVVRRTETPAGPDLRLMDVGAVTQGTPPAPPGTSAGAPAVPVVTLAPDPAAPTTRALATLTNVAALGEAGAAVEFQMLVQAATPTADDEGAAIGTIPTPAESSLATPAVPAGSTVWVRAQARLLDTTVSGWSAWASVTLDTITDGGGDVPGGGSGAPFAPALAWTISGAGVVDVTAVVDGRTVAVKFAASTSAMPSSATVRAATADSAAPFQLLAAFTLAEGATGYVAAYSYDSAGNESALGTAVITRGTAPGGALASRASVPFTTASVASGATVTGTITVPKGFALYKLAADNSCRVRLYRDAFSRTADAARATTTKPAAGSGVLADTSLATANALAQWQSPPPLLYNADGPAAGLIYYAVTNYMTVAVTITVTLTDLALES